MSFIQRAFSVLRSKKDEEESLEQMIEEATNDHIWQVPTSQLHEIANRCFFEESFKITMQKIWKKLKQSSQSVKSIEKTLYLLDFLLKNGPARCSAEARLELWIIRQLEQFVWLENGIDKGSEVRERAQTLAKLLADDKRLEFERENAKNVRENMTFSYSNKSLPPHLGCDQTKGFKEDGVNSEDNNKAIWDRYALEIFNNKAVDDNICQRASVSDKQVEAARELKAKWQNLEKDFLQFDDCIKSANDMQQLDEFEDLPPFPEVKKTKRAMKIFEEVAPRPRLDSKIEKPFEDWWETPYQSDSHIDKENRTPNKISTEQPKKALSKGSFEANFTLKWESTSNANDQRLQEDWLNGNPFANQPLGSQKRQTSSNFFDF